MSRSSARPAISPEPEQVFISLGSNIEPASNLVAAGRALAERFGPADGSYAYASPAVGGPAGSPDFLNAALLFETDLDPEELKYDILRPLEAALGRLRNHDRYAPRTIDLDLALWGHRIVNDPSRGITLPDPDLRRFAHIAVPLADLAPEFVDPVSGETLREIAAHVPGLETLSRVDLGADSPFRSPAELSGAAPSNTQSSTEERPR